MSIKVATSASQVTIPALLLSIPAPQVELQYIANGKLTLSMSQAAAATQAYKAEVAGYLRANRHFLSEGELTPALDLALMLFNCENFTGELVPSEREHFRAVYARFGAACLFANAKPTTTTTTTAAAEEQDEESTAKKKSDDELKDAYLRRLLTSDGEMASPCVRLSGLLLCLVAIASATEVPLADAASATTSTAGGTAATHSSGASEGVPLVPYTNIWRLRTHFRHQLCLTHRAHTVFTNVAACIDALLMRPSEDISVHDLIEVGHAQNYYHQRELAAGSFRCALRKSGLELEEAAVMGVRTRWQQQQMVQRILNAKSSREVPPESLLGDQPTVVMSEKDGHDLLDHPRSMPDAAPLALTPLHPDDKAIILALCTDIRNNNPDYGLTHHHMQTYVERLLSDPSPAPFAIAAQILLVRARLEMRRNRVQERAFMQFTELVDQFSARRDPTHETFSRTDSTYFYTVAYPSVWSVKREYGDFCYEENLFKTALEMYEQVLDFDKIIECCKKLDKRRRAESLARDLLEKDPDNPLLWVALGEATRDDAHLWKAWELCQHKMAAPMRSLARLALDREQYQKVVEYFDLAVAINPVFGGDWFSLGYAALRLKNWERSGEAFTRVCQIDPNDAFAWNNLASIMLRENKLRPAFNAMSQALRNNRRNWRMWQNYFQIGTRLKEVTETTNALNIALDIAKRSIDLDRETLEMYVDNNIAYLSGKIPGSFLEAEESEEVQANNVRYKAPGIAHVSTTDIVVRSSDEGAVEDDDDAELDAQFAELQPFGADVELPDSFFPHSSDATAARVGQQAALKEAILMRHKTRLRSLFARILDMFVTDPDIYACAAKLFNYLDGPMASYKYRLKELRECQQKDQWERKDTLFKRTVDCLEDTINDTYAAFAMAQAEIEEGPAGTCVSKAPSPAVASAEVEEEGAATTPARRVTVTVTNINNTSDVTASSPRAVTDPQAATVVEPHPTGEALQQAVIDAFKQALDNIKAALEVSEEHMENTADYARLRALATRARAGLQEAKAVFV